MSEEQLHVQYSQTIMLFPEKITAFYYYSFLIQLFFWSWNQITLTLTRMFHESIRCAFINVLVIAFPLG